MAYRFNPLLGIGLDDTGNDADAAAGGSDTQVQYNDGGSLAGSADLTWDDTGKELNVGGDINLDDGGTYETTVQVVTPTANRTISFPDATGTVALVAGSSGQLTYNSSGAQAGLTSASIGSTGEINISLAGAASTPPVSFTGSWFTGGTSTTTKPQLLIEPTGTTSTAWSTSGTGLGVNAASGFAGRLLDLQTNGTSQMVVQGDGKLGIGTTSPSTTLEVIGDAKIGETSYPIRFATGASTGVIEYPATSSRSVLRTLGSTPLEFEINSGNPVARIDDSGNFGIATATPGDKLEIGGAGAGIILASPDGTRYRLTVANGGTLSIAAV